MSSVNEPISFGRNKREMFVSLNCKSVLNSKRGYKHETRSKHAYWVNFETR